MSVIPALKRPRQENCVLEPAWSIREFQASQGYVARLSHKPQTKHNQEWGVFKAQSLKTPKESSYAEKRLWKPHSPGPSRKQMSEKTQHTRVVPLGENEQGQAGGAERPGGKERKREGERVREKFLLQLGW